MKTEEFKDGLEELVKIAKDNKTTIMCAELLWFKCHRRFISDKLIELGFKVSHIFDKNKIYEHKLREL